jgi:predicted nucleic acid-binding protein
VIALDTNILVAFHRLEYSSHEAAVRVLTGLAEGIEPWALPWPCAHEFLAVVTNRRIFQQPTSPREGLLVVDALLESPTIRLLGEARDTGNACRDW